MTSDFFLEEADAWRDEAWAIMRHAPDVQRLQPLRKVLVRKYGRSMRRAAGVTAARS